MEIVYEFAVVPTGAGAEALKCLDVTCAVAVSSTALGYVPAVGTGIDMSMYKVPEPVPVLRVVFNPHRGVVRVPLGSALVSADQYHLIRDRLEQERGRWGLTFFEFDPV